jgi:hypothetical protein
MSKAIGPNFSNELARVNLIGLPFAWDADGNIHFDDAMTAPQRAAVEAVYDAHDPTLPDPSAEAVKLQRGGLAITSAANPMLNGTYGSSQTDETNVTGMQVAVAAGVFPGFYRDAGGGRHAMTGVEFTAIATALLRFIVEIEEAKATALEGGAWSAPASTVNIA